jgi:hypothetical protein
MWKNEFVSFRSVVRGPSRLSVGPDPVSTLHGGPVASNRIARSLYADDTQIYGFCRPEATAQLQDRVSACAADVALWMRSNRLQLNTAKTEVLWCSSARRQHQIPSVPLIVGLDAVTSVNTVRDLGIYIDSDMSMRSHVLKTVSNRFAVLGQI